jgi:hypothetical protein
MLLGSLLLRDAIDEYAIDAIFEIGTVAAQAIHEQGFHGVCALNQCFDLGQFLVGEGLPAFGERALHIQFVQEYAHLGNREAGLLRDLNEREAAQDVGAVTSLPADALWLW